MATTESISTGDAAVIKRNKLLEKLRLLDAKRGSAVKWTEVKNALFRVGVSSGGVANNMAAASTVVQRSVDDQMQTTKKSVETLSKHVPVTTLELMLEKLEDCARNVVNADTNTCMQFTVQHGFDVFLSSDTFYVEIKLNPLAKSNNEPGKNRKGV